MRSHEQVAILEASYGAPTPKTDQALPERPLTDPRFDEATLLS